ncbi:MAG: acyltransferase [Firmicutes bacterium]|nr:acyltransferase [Bacillota bacterium]
MNKRIQWLSAVRVLGQVMVLVYHFFRELLPGGFLGVDVFFTLSGYLTTALAVAEFQKSGGFGLAAFGKRRFLRIAPPLFFSILFTLPLTLLVSPDFTANIAKQAAGALGFVSNFFEIRTGGSYEANVLPHLYLHTWALSVEMHFYILWGLICAVLALLLRRTFKKNAEKTQRGFKISMITISLAGAAVSYIAMQRAYVPGADSSAAYFSSLSHAFPFFIGAAAATLMGIKLDPKSQRRLKKKPAKALCAMGLILSILGIAALALLLHFDDPYVYRFGFLAASLLAACAIFSARALHEAAPGKREPRLLSVSADLSYNIYLYHWPLYVMASALLADNNLAVLAALGASIVLSALVFYGIEPLFFPPRKAAPARREAQAKRKHKSKAVSMPVLLAALLIGAVVRHRRKWMAAVTALLMLACALPVGLVLRRAPELTSIEENIYAGFLLQDRDILVSRREWLDSLNGTPLRFGGEITAMPELKENEPPPERAPAIPVISALEVSGGVTILGDSICVDARAMLLQNIPNCTVDALSSRPLSVGYEIMMDMQQKGTLREVVVYALGTNSIDEFAEYIQKIIDGLEPGHKLVFVVPFDGRTPDYGRAYRTAMLEYTLPAQYDFVTLADWRGAISGNVHLLGSDKCHLGKPASRQIYVGVIAEAVRTASRGPAK